MALLIRCEGCPEEIDVVLVQNDRGATAAAPEPWVCIEVAVRPRDEEGVAPLPLYMYGGGCEAPVLQQNFITKALGESAPTKAASLVAHCDGCDKDIRAKWSERRIDGRVVRRLELPMPGCSGRSRGPEPRPYALRKAPRPERARRPGMPLECFLGCAAIPSAFPRDRPQEECYERFRDGARHDGGAVGVDRARSPPSTVLIDDILRALSSLP